MDLTHSFTVPTSVDDAWALFMDLEAVGGCFPGATVTEVTDNGFTGTVKVKLGPIALVYAGSGSFIERDDAAHRAVIDAKGKDKRGNGTAGATVTIQLAPDGDGTRADVATDLAITGKPAQFGRGVMQDVSDKLLGQFVACIEQRLGQAEAEPEAAPPDDVAAAAATSQPAKAASAKAASGKAASGKAASGKAASGKAASGKAASGKAASGKAASEKAEPAKAASAKAAPAKVGSDEVTPDSATQAEVAAATAGEAGSSSALRPTQQIGDTEVDEGAITVTGGRTNGSGPTTAAFGPATTTGAPATSTLRSVPTADDDAIDLGAALGPVLVRRYGGFAVAGLVGLCIGWLLGRRRS